MTTPPIQNKNTKRSLLGKMKNSSLYFYALAIAMLAVACKKEESNIGANLIPDGDKLNLFTYEIPLQFKTITEDTLKTNGFGAVILGSCYDPIFGRSSASLATEFKLNSPLDFGTGLTIDSVVLSMEYLSSTLLPYYGDVTKLNGAQRFKVYELTETLSADSTYYSNHTPQYNATLWGEKVIVPNFTDSIRYTQGTVKNDEGPQLRIKLNNNAINKLLSAQPSDLAGTDAFYNFFKGLYIVPDNDNFQSPGQGAFLRFNAVTEKKSKIRIFYRNSTSVNNTERPYEFVDLVMNTNTRRYQVYKHAYSGTEVATNIQNGVSAQRLYVQGLAGVKTKIILPNFDTIANFMANGTYVVNSAELVIPVEENTITNTFPAIGTLFVVSPSSDSKYDGIANPPNTAIADAISLPASFYGGSYDKDKKEYKFRIPLYMANILNKAVVNKGLYLVCSGANAVPQRVVISNTADRKIHFRLTYTKI